MRARETELPTLKRLNEVNICRNMQAHALPHKILALSNIETVRQTWTDRHTVAPSGRHSQAVVFTQAKKNRTGWRTGICTEMD